MNLFLYNFVLFLSLPFMVGRILLKSMKDSDYKKHFLNRFGIYENQHNLKEIVWFHAVSLGEVISSQNIVKTIAKENNVVLSVTTPTGLREAKKIFGLDVEVVYAPWDLKCFISNYFKTYEPKSLILFETEIWPNMITQSFKKKIPIILSNGRMSESSFKRYKKFNFLSNLVFQKITLAFVQSEAHRERFALLGVDNHKIRNAGSVKFDVEVNQNPLRNTIKNKILLAASTHKKEDEIMIKSYVKLLEENEGLKLIIVPRHPDRAESIQSLLHNYRLDSTLCKEIPQDFTKNNVYVIKATGLLKKLYSIATLAYVGGSLFKEYGGHNIIEPASQRCPFIVGPFMKNFLDIINDFKNQDACIQIQNEKELFNAFQTLLNDDELRDDMSTRAAEVCLKSQGSLQEQCNTILKIIGGDRVEISNSNY
jgi:3-deoxy-D-manno-octulosonic-acid transferase